MLQWALLLIAGQTYAHDLAAADKTFAGAYPLPVEDRALYQLMEALQAYEAIAEKYGTKEVIQRRIGACLIESGKYKDAVEQSPIGSAEKKRAGELLSLAKRFEKLVKGTVTEVVPEPGRPRYLVLSVGKDAEDELQEDLHGDADKLSYVEIPQGGQPKILDQRPVDCQYVPAGCKIYLAPLRYQGPKAAIVYRALASDGDRSEITVYTFGDRKLTKAGSFFANQGSAVHPVGKLHGLTIVIGPSWKVGWQDAYEWTNGKFQFANARRADLLAMDVSLTGPSSLIDGESYTYPDWMTYAAMLDIQHKFVRAKGAWIRAERLCRKALTSKVPFRVQFYGDVAVNLKEIQQRIRWIDRHDYGHALLYRPTDNGLLVPPFKLGHAND